MKYGKYEFGLLSLVAATCGGCAVSADDDPDAIAFEEGLGSEGDFGSKEQAYGEGNCPIATPDATINAAPDRSMAFTVADQNNPTCTWTRVLRVNNVIEGAFFFNRYDDVVPINPVSCEAISVTLDTYKLVSGSWVLDAQRNAYGVWNHPFKPNACTVPQVHRRAPSAGTYKLILNGRYSRLSYEHRVKIKLTTDYTVP